MLKKGFKHSEETKRKIREALKGKRCSPRTEIKKGEHRGLATEFKKGQTSGSKSPLWIDGRSKHPKYRSFIEKQRELKKKGNGGSHTLGNWENLKAQYNWTCPACREREPEIKLTEDHIVPISKGGSNNIENIQPLCRSCNSKKYKQVIKYDKNIT